MSSNKNFCPTHHLYYNGLKCPMCESEHIEMMSRKYSKSNSKKPVNEQKKDKTSGTVSDEALARLVEKFNVR